MNKCINCCKKTSNPKFCSKSCSAIVNNKVPKRKWKCKKCNLHKIKSSKWSRLCTSCYKPKMSYVSKYKTLGEMKLAIPEFKYGHLQLHAVIREQSRRIFLNKGNYSCQNCKYDKHIEVCHIKPVTSFSDNSLISEINHISNLIGLCPNCHWEFDNGLLNLNKTSALTN